MTQEQEFILDALRIAMKKKAIESLEKTDTAIPETGISPAGNDWCSDKELMKWLKSL